MKQRISTANVTEGDALDAWRSWLANKLHAVDIRDYDPTGFYSECNIDDAGELSIAKFRGSKQSFIRTNSMIRQSEFQYYLATIVTHSTSSFWHNGHMSRCGPGDVLLLDTEKPYEVVHDSSVQVLNFIIPSHILKTALGPIDVAAGLVLDGQDLTTRLIRSHLQNFARHADRLDPDVARRMSLAAVDMIATGFEEKLGRGDHARDRHWMFVAKAKAFIRSRLEKQDLDLTTIADFMGTTPRRLQEVFAAHGTSVMKYLWEQRLMLSERFLKNDVRQQMNVSSIGYRSGFVSPAHFTRRFKARFGVTPTEYRQKHSSRAEQNGAPPSF